MGGRRERGWDGGSGEGGRGREGEERKRKGERRKMEGRERETGEGDNVRLWLNFSLPGGSIQNTLVRHDCPPN